jgi:hypothetical protein
MPLMIVLMHVPPFWQVVELVEQALAKLARICVCDISIKLG